MGHVPHLLVPGSWDGPTVPLDEAATHHLRRALRRSEGDPVTYTNGLGRLGRGTLVGNGVDRGEETEVARPIRAVMAVAPPAHKERVRFVVEKLAELGILELWWLDTEYGEGRVPAADKVEAWCRSALEQSRAAWLMTVRSDLVGIGSLPEGAVFADRSGAAADLHAVSCIAIGPEGGWSDDELPKAARTVSLGSSVLRVETAAIAAAAIANSRRSSESDHAEW